MTEQPWSESRIETKSEQASRWTERKTKTRTNQTIKQKAKRL